MLVSATHQHKSVIGIHMSPLSFEFPSHLPPIPPSKLSLRPRNIFYFFNWRIITLQYCISFCCIMWISYAFSRFSRVRLFATPWTIACHTPLSMEFSQARILEWVVAPPPGDLPNPGIEPVSPALRAVSLPLSHQGGLNQQYVFVYPLLLEPPSLPHHLTRSSQSPEHTYS